MAFLGDELSPDSKNFQNIMKGTSKAKISPSGMVLSGPKRVPGRCLRGYALTGAPGERNASPPLWIRYCSSTNKIEIILHSLRSGVIPPCVLSSCRQPHPSKAAKSVGCPGAPPPPPPPPPQPPLGRSRGFTDAPSHQRVSLLATFYTSGHVFDLYVNIVGTNHCINQSVSILLCRS